MNRGEATADSSPTCRPRRPRRGNRPCGRWVPLMGGTPATHGVALAAAPWQRSPGSRFVRLRSRRPSPPNGCARWLPEVAIAPPWSPGWASRAGSPSAVVRRSPGSRLLGVGSTGAHLPGLALPWQPARSVQARYGFRCTESSCPPAAGRRTAPRSLSPKGKRRDRDACCVPAQVLSPRARSGSRAPCAQVPRTPSSPSLSRAA